jgi:serine acetyltransferase
VPTIGNNVYIGPGVRIVGSVRVGDNVVIGPNSVVVRNVKSDCVVVGVPAEMAMRIPEGGLDAIRGTLDRGLAATDPQGPDRT